MLEKLKKNSKIFFLLLTVIFTLPVTFGFINVGFPLTDDGNWMVIRLSAFYEALGSGQFPVRFLLRLNNGFGYPVADFLYPLFLYIGSLIHLVGFSFVESVKIILGVSLIFSSVFSFLWLRKIFGNISSFVGSLVFTLFPYHLFDIYKRGSVGEALSISILPFVLWQIERKSIFFTSFGIFLLITAHNTLAVFFLPLLLGYVLLTKQGNLKFLIASLVLGILSASFFWLPAIYDSQYTVFSSIQVSDFYNYFFKLTDLLILGLIFVVEMIASFTLLINKRLNTNKFFIFSTICSLIILILLLPISKVFWDLMPFKQLIQFPFRLISLIIVFAAFQSSFVIDKLKNRNQIVTSAFFVVVIMVSAIPFLLNIKYQDYPDTFYSTNLSTTTVKNEYMPKWVKVLPENYPISRVNINGNEKVEIISYSQRKINFKSVLNQEKEIFVNIIYYPGWEAYVNGSSIVINYNNPKGLIGLNLNEGQNDVTVIFKETPVRLFADILTIIGFCLIFVISIYINITKRKEL